MVLKKAFTEAFPDFRVGDPFILTTDWSKENIAGCYPKCETDRKKILGCWGRKCNQYESEIIPVTRGSC